MSLPGLIMMGYFLGSLAIIIECTQKAYESSWTQNMLHDFAAETGCTVHQRLLLGLHSLWPARRDRWWCILSHPALNLSATPDLPSIPFEPSVLHVLQSPHWGSSLEVEQLEAVKGGIRASIMDPCKPCPTATHSWGSQLRECLSRRKHGFHPERLRAKGL